MAFNNSSLARNHSEMSNNVTIGYYPDYTATEKGALIFTMAFISLLAVPGNCIVIYVISRVQNMRTSTNMLLLNLCIADLLIAVLYLPFITVDLYLTGSWIFGGFMCRVVSFSQSVGTKASILILTGISLERYLTVCKSNLVLVTPRRTRIMCWVLWGIAMLVAMPFLIVKTTKPDGDVYYCSEDWSYSHARAYTLVVLLLFYVVPLCVMTILYVKIGQKLWQSTKKTTSMRLSAGSKATISSKARLTKICIAIILSFVLSWAPSHALTLVYYFMEMSIEAVVTVNMVIFPIVVTLAFSNCALNPLLYCFMSQNFRNALASEWKRFTGDRNGSIWNELPGINKSSTRSRFSTFRTMSSRIFEQQGSSPQNSRENMEGKQDAELRTSVITIFESSV